MQELLAWAREVWPVLFSALHLSAASWVTVDAVPRKRHAPAVVGWVGLAWVAPIAGAVAYFLLGINRIQRSASALGRPAPATSAADGVGAGVELAQAADPAHPGLSGLVRLGNNVTGRPLLAGNRIEPLNDGDPAFPAMLAAIDGATRSAVINLLDPDVIVLGGGLSNVTELMRDVPTRWVAHVFSDVVTTPLGAAVHGGSSGVRGAAWLWRAHP